MKLTKDECKLIAVHGIFAFADVFSKGDDDFHEYYTINTNKTKLSVKDYYLPTGKEIEWVCEEMNRWANKLQKRTIKLKNKINTPKS